MDLVNGGLSFTGVLDGYASGLAVAYSVSRRLLASYSGDLIRVRRSGDNAEADFGFDALGDLDSAALAAWVVAGGGTQHGYVTTIYAQNSSGAGNITQATAANQPQIVASGALLTENSKPVAVFDGSDDTMGVTWSGGTTFSAYTVFKLNAAGNFPMVLILNDANLEFRGDGTSGNLSAATSSSSLVNSFSSVGAFNQCTWQNEFPGNYAAWADDASFGTPVITLNNAIATVNLGSRSGSFLANMDFSELFIFSTVHGTTDRQAIQAIQKDYFGTA